MEVKSTPKTGKLKEPVGYFGWDAAPRRPGAWQGWFQWRIPLLCTKEGPEHTNRGCGDSSLTWLLTLSLLTLASPRLSSASPRCIPGFFVVFAFLFGWVFLALLRNTTLTTLEAGCPVLEPRRRSAWGRRWRLGSCTGRALSLLLGVSHGTQPPPRWYPLLVCSLCLFWCLSHWSGLRLSWISAVLQGMPELQALTPGRAGPAVRP